MSILTSGCSQEHEPQQGKFTSGELQPETRTNVSQRIPSPKCWQRNQKLRLVRVPSNLISVKQVSKSSSQAASKQNKRKLETKSSVTLPFITADAFPVVSRNSDPVSGNCARHFYCDTLAEKMHCWVESLVLKFNFRHSVQQQSSVFMSGAPTIHQFVRLNRSPSEWRWSGPACRSDDRCPHWLFEWSLNEIMAAFVPLHWIQTMQKELKLQRLLQERSIHHHKHPECATVEIWNCASRQRRPQPRKSFKSPAKWAMFSTPLSVSSRLRKYAASSR